MRLEVVHADAFGPLRAQKLELAPGMNVLFGPNESGKSSWHAAIYAGLCGIRRGPGIRNDAREFAARHHPWRGDEWSASVVVLLADGRRIRIGQNLADLADCQATDVSMGRDVSNEIMFEGTPDGSRFLGLDRYAFLSTACVRQTDLDGVRADARRLQSHIQRAAAAHNTDATAASALEAITAFKREHVGLARANATRPLQRAIERVRLARSSLDEARRSSDVLAQREQTLRATVERAEDLHANVASLEAGLERARLEALRIDLARVDELAAALSTDAPAAPDPVELQEARDALAGLAATPTTSTATETAAELRTKLAALPETAIRDLEPDPAVVEHGERLKDANRRIELMDETRPQPPTTLTPSISAEELRSLASALREPLPPPPMASTMPSGAGRLRARRAALLAVTCLLAALGVGLLFVQPALGVGALVFAVAAAVSAVVIHGRLAEAESQSQERGPAGLTDDERVRRDGRDESLARIRQLGLPEDPEELTRLAERQEADDAALVHLQAWAEKRAALVQAAEDAAQEVSAALTARDVDQSGTPLERYQCYVEACSVARRRQLLEDQIAARMESEASTAAHERAANRLREVAKLHSIDVGRHPDLIAIDVRGWVARAAAAGDRARVIQQHRVELETLLRGRTIDDLRADVNELERSLGDVAALTRSSMTIEEIESALQQARAQARAAADAANTLRGQLSEFIAGMDSVAEAEEELREAEDALSRIEQLGETLDLAHSFLEQAQERVHRDIAPVLKATIDAYIGRITGGHYVEAAVDPKSLHVRVVESSGQYRDATLLSHGTTEQIYLLLRVALAEHLTTPGEVCPLILDEVTVQSDATRTRAILEVLQDLAEDRQIILFTQEDDVRDWAEDRLKTPDHRIEYLSL